jgi:minor extracellular serine protease Vpr
MKRFAVFIPAVLFTALSVAAQVLPDRYIVELTGEPAAAYAVRLGHRAHSDDAEFRARVSVLQQQHVQMRRTLQAKGARVTGETNAVTNMLFVRFPSARSAELAAIPGVRHVYPMRQYHLTLDHALPLERVPDAWAQIGGVANAGVGVKVAIIDTGIDPQHPGFNDASLSPPAGFPKSDNTPNAAYATNKIIVTRSYSQSSVDGSALPALPTDGHGTGVAMIVAGANVAGPYGPISGIAPKAFLGNYRVFDDQSSPRANDDWIIAAINDAVSDGMDILTLSLGSPEAGRPADEPVVQAVEAAIAAGKTVTISAGNNGSDPNTIGTPGIAPDAITVGARPNDRLLAASVQADGMPPVIALPGNGPNSPTPIAGPLADVAQFDPSGMACGSLPAKSLSGAIALILRGACTFEVKLNNVQQAGAIAAVVYNDAARLVLFSMDVGAATLPANSISYPDGAALKQALAGGPLNATVVFTLVPFPVGINRLTDFSSRGPNSDYSIKPDILAVGESVYTADLNSGYVVESGTSFSAPMLAGSAALIQAARPGLTAQQYRSLLINSANSVIQDSGAPLTIQQQGSGFLNVLAALNATVTAYPTSLSYGIGSGTFDQTSMLALTNVGKAPDTFSITVQPLGAGPTPTLSANMIQLNPGQTQNVSVEFAGAALDPGAYQGFLQIQGAQNQTVATVPYWYGVPSDAAVNMTVLFAPTNGPSGTRQVILVRPTDSQGLPTSTTPTVTVTSGGGRVNFVQSVDDQVPGSYYIQVRLAPLGGATVFHIVSGSASADVTIQSP